MNLWAQRLSPRLRQTLHLMAAGYRNKEIANRMDVTYATNRRHRTELYRKLGVASRTEAVVMAIKFEIVDSAAVYREIDRRNGG